MRPHRLTGTTAGRAVAPHLVHADGTPGANPYRTPVVVGTRAVTRDDTLDVAMAPAGGRAVVLRPS
ncbi:hypothetical protein ACWCQ0_26390 [Streptomyces massasporeus]|uniref:Uncharacterized protein n=1 Tax=Streptomyces massasporeus TaxID=67324 RepID=A0ABW6LR86_9ACTN